MMSQNCDKQPATGGDSDNETTIGSKTKQMDEIASRMSAGMEAGQDEKLPFPKSVFFIIGNEFCERFNYYGMRTILVIYLTQELGYSDDDATVVFHFFTTFVYSLCVIGAIISDSWLGKFKTIMFISVIYVAGSIMIALGAIPTLKLPVVAFTMLGLSLIAMGSGGIKPCVSTFGGDQFKLPEQTKQMVLFFHMFYFAINAGSLISTALTPILRKDVHCFGHMACYSLAFGVPAVLMTVAVVVFALGFPLYKNAPLTGNMMYLVCKTIVYAILTKYKQRGTSPREHWLDYASEKYDKQLIEDIKVLMRILVLYLPVPLFWALFDQQGSRWTLQATRMNGDMGSWDIKPDQMQMINPLLILIFIPLFAFGLYPLISLIGIRRPLQKLTIGGVLAGIAFIISAILEFHLEKTYPVLPARNLAHFRVFNGEACDYRFSSNVDGMRDFTVNSMSYYVNRDVQVPDGKLDFRYTIKESGAGCPTFESSNYVMSDKKAFSLFLASKNVTTPQIWYEDFVNKPIRGNPMGRVLANVNPGRKITWRNTKESTNEHTETAYQQGLIELSTGDFEILVDDTVASKITLNQGGVYSVVVNELSTGDFSATPVVVTEPNTINLLWLSPQYIVITAGEVLFSVTGLEFTYSQAPVSMKSVVMAVWLLAVAFGNVFVVIIAKMNMFNSQAYEFLLFAGLMFVDMLWFAWLAYRYKPNNLT